MPITTVRKITGPVIALISWMKASASHFASSAGPGATSPKTMPRAIATMTQNHSCLRKPLSFMSGLIPGSLNFQRVRPTTGGMTPVTTTPRAERYRLVTRSDFDGLVCAALLKHLGILDDILFVHPKDVQDGKVEIGPNDVTTNLPYSENAAISFDHHSSEATRVGGPRDNHVIVPGAQSAARVVYDYYGGAEVFPGIEELMDAVDKGDAAQFSLDEILRPTGWVMLNFLMDPRTGLGRFREFEISNYQLMMQLIDVIVAMTIDEVFENPHVKERVELYNAHAEAAVEQISRCSTVHGNLVVLDLRDEEVIHPTNRFTLYALFPRVQHLDPRALGPAPAEHGVRDRQVDPRPRLEDQRRPADAVLRRRRARRGRHLPGRERGRRARARRAGTARSTPTANVPRR